MCWWHFSSSLLLGYLGQNSAQHLAYHRHSVNRTFSFSFLSFERVDDKYWHIDGEHWNDFCWEILSTPLSTYFQNLEMFHLFHCFHRSPSNHRISPGSLHLPSNWPSPSPFSDMLTSLYFLSVLSHLASMGSWPLLFSFKWPSFRATWFASLLPCRQTIVIYPTKFALVISFQIADRHLPIGRSHSSNSVLPFFHKN